MMKDIKNLLKNLIKKRKEDFGSVALYMDKSRTLYAIPCGWDRITQKAVNTAYIDLLFILRQPYTDSDVEAFLFNALNHCFTKEKESGPGPLEKHFKVNSWLQAVRNLKHVTFEMNQSDVLDDSGEVIQEKGYHFMPTTKIPRLGYIPQTDKWIHIGANPQNGELARALNTAFCESTC